MFPLGKSGRNLTKVNRSKKGRILTFRIENSMIAQSLQNPRISISLTLGLGLLFSLALFLPHSGGLGHYAAVPDYSWAQVSSCSPNILLENTGSHACHHNHPCCQGDVSSFTARPTCMHTSNNRINSTGAQPPY